MSQIDPMTFDAAAVTAVIGYTERVKMLLPEGWSKYGALISCGLGILYAVALRPGDTPLAQSLASGLMVGLAASGGYAGMKHYVEARRQITS